MSTTPMLDAWHELCRVHREKIKYPPSSFEGFLHAWKVQQTNLDAQAKQYQETLDELREAYERLQQQVAEQAGDA